MIARNFTPQSQWLSGYAQFLQLSDEDFLDVDQLKSTDYNNLSTLQQQLHHLQNEGASHQRPQEENQFENQQQEQQNDYYELTPLAQTQCFNPMFLAGSSDGGGQQVACEAGVGNVGGVVGAGSGTPSSTPALQPEGPTPGISRTINRKRRNSYQDASDFDDDTEDSKSCRTDGKKQNHSEIEKRRRDKMNTYITELSSMVPMCHAMSRKLDKLTVLRMAVQHLRTIRGAVHSYAEGNYKPSFLSDEDLKQLILQTAEGFLFVVGCDRGRILFVSESVSQILNFSQGDLLGQSWFDILHPKDVAKVKEQLSSSDLSPRERLIDAKTMLPVKADMPSGGSRLCPGARRSFFCRMKRKINSPSKEDRESSGGGGPSTPSNSNGSSALSGSNGPSAGAQNAGRLQRKTQGVNDRKYSVVHCTGYLKSWAPEKVGLCESAEIAEVDGDADGEASNLLCLVAVGRLQPVPALALTGTPGVPPAAQTTSSTGRQSHKANRRVPPLRPVQFTSKHAVDGKFLFVDQRATPVLGFLPQELLGTSMYEYYHPDDVEHLAASHKAALATTDRVKTKVYWFRNKDSSYACLQSEWRAFKNPWTKDLEYLISKNTVVRLDSGQLEVANAPKDRPCQSGYDFFSQSTGNQREMQNAISSHVEASKIGRQVADEALDGPRPYQDCDATTASHSQQLIGANASAASPTQPVAKPRSFNAQVEMKQTVMNPPPTNLLPPPPPRPVTSMAGAMMTAVMSPVSAAVTPVSSSTSSPQRDLTSQRPGHKSPLTATSVTAATPPSPATECRLSSPALSRSSETGSYVNGTIRNNVTLSSLAASETGLGNEEDVAEMMGSVLAESPGQGAPGDSNDEAAMAVVMSLLEADSELGERVDFSGLLWPLP